MPENLPANPQQHSPEDIAGWQNIADTMHEWHPGLRAHAERIITERGIPVEMSQRALVDAVEAVSFHRAAGEAEIAAKQLPQKEGYQGGFGRERYPRAETFTAIAHLNERVFDDAFAALGNITDSYTHTRVLEKLIPVGVATGHARELIDGAIESDEKSSYNHDTMRKAVAIELAKTDVKAALDIIPELKRDKQDSSDEGAYSINSVFESIIKVAPESAPEVYQNLKTYVEASEHKDKYVGSLLKLAPYVPEAGKQALDLLTVAAPETESDRQAIERAGKLVTLSKEEPSALVSAIEVFSAKAYASGDGYRYRSSFDEDEIGKVRGSINEAISEAVDQGDIATAAAAISALHSRHYTDHKLRERLFDACLQAGEPQLALGSVEHLYVSQFKKALPLLAKQGDIETITAMLDKFSDHTQYASESLAAAACYVPELVDVAKTKLQQSREGQRYLEDGLKGVEIGSADIASMRELLHLMPVAPDDRYRGKWHDLALDLARIDPVARQERLMEIRQDERVARKVGDLLHVANGESAIIDEALTAFRTEMVPGLSSDSEYLQDEAYKNIAGIAPSLVGSLEADGRHAEALEVMQSVRNKEVLGRCLLELEPTSPEEVAGNFAALNDQPKFIDAYSKKLAASLSTEQLKEVLVMIPEEYSGVRATLIKDLAPQFVASGDTAALFALVPEQANGSYAEALKSLIAELAQNPNQAGLEEALSRIEDDRECLEALLPLLETNPDLASLAFSRIQTLELRSAYQKASLDSFKALALIKLMPLLPDSIAYSAELAQSLSIEDSRAYGYKDNVETLTKLAEGFAKNGSGGEAFEIISRLGWQGQTLFKEIAPDLVENGWGAAALDYARAIKDPAERAYCLAAIIPPQDDEAWNQKREIAESIFGTGALELATHEASDRSVNISLFVGDIAEHPLIVETFLSRASNPAELLRVMQAVDQAAGGLEDGSHLQIQALQMLTRFTSGFVMQEQWRKDLQEQALGGEKADTYLFKQLANLQQLTRNLENLNQSNLQSLIQSGYTAEQIFTHPWLATTEIANLGTDIYPFTKGTSTQQEWLADHAFVRLDGFDRRAIGRLLETRLNNNLEYTLHDASQWLQAFAVPDVLEAYDPTTNTTEHRPLKDAAAEEELLGTILHSSLTADELRRLPGFASAGGEIGELKTQKFEALFADPAHTILYAALLQTRAQGDNISIEDVKQTVKVWTEAGIIEAWVGNGKEITDSGAMTDRILAMVDTISEQPSIMAKIPPQINYLRELSKNRTAYINSSLTWIRSYQNLSGQRLASAWANRTDAMRDGIEDRPAAIEEWVKQKGLRDYFATRVDSEGNLPSGVTPSALLERFPKFTTELPSRYGPERSANALERLNQVFNPEADLPAAEIALEGGYTFKVFAKDDPAGMTIGHDTDCCMTLEGASESCIYTGYSEPSAGFVGLYDGSNKLVAQSFVWHNDGTLVLDNIEAQRGRNLSNIQGQYKTALEQYLKELHVSKPEVGLRAVNIGTGYLEARLSEGLNRTEAVRPKIRLGYSDAGSQLELVRLTQQDLEATPETLQVRELEHDNELARPPQAHPEFSVVIDPRSQADEISRLEAQIYPNELQTGRAEILSDLRESGNFSFLIGSRTGNSGFVGYAIAYKDKSKDAVYVSDLAILPNEQRNGYGVAAIEHLLRQVDEAGEERLIFEARESTSYRALQSPNVQALLEQHGFAVTSSEQLSNYFDNGETAYNIELRKLAVAS